MEDERMDETMTEHVKASATSKLTQAQQKILGRIIGGEKDLAVEICALYSRVAEVEGKLTQLVESLNKGK